MTVAAQDAIWLRNILKEIGFEQECPTQISSNNQSTIALAKSPIFHQRTKHVEIQAHFNREKVLDGTLQPKYCPSKLNSVDMFTKPLSEAQFCKLREFIGLVKLPSRGSEVLTFVCDNNFTPRRIFCCIMLIFECALIFCSSPCVRNLFVHFVMYV